MGLGSLISGACSAVGSAISGACSIVGGAISGVCSVAGSALSRVFSSATSLCSKIASTVLGKGAMALLGKVGSLVLGPLGPVLGPIVAELILRKVIEIVVKALSGTKEQDVDKMGYRLEEANKRENKDWKRPEDFNDFDEYYEYLKQQIPDEKIDKEKLAKDRQFYETVGISALSQEIGKKYGIETPVEFFFDAARCYMEENEVQAFIMAYKELGYETLTASDYLQGKVTPEERKNIRNALLDSLKSLYPKENELVLKTRLFEMEKCSQDDLYMANKYYKKQLEDINQNGLDSKYLKERVHKSHLESE